MADPDARPEAGGAAATPAPRSTAQQVTFGLTVASLIVAVTVMGAWWIAADPPAKASTAFVYLFATIGVWVTVYRLLVFGIKRMVRGRIERARAERG